MNEDNRRQFGRRSDEEFMAAARVELERSVHDIDALTAARLRAMRMRAMDEAKPAVLRPAWWQPAGSIAVAIVLVLGWVLLAQHTGAEMPEADAYELLAAGHGHDSIDNPEFYEWLDAQYETGDAPELDEI